MWDMYSSVTVGTLLLHVSCLDACDQERIFWSIPRRITRVTQYGSVLYTVIWASAVPDHHHSLISHVSLIWPQVINNTKTPLNQTKLWQNVSPRLLGVERLIILKNGVFLTTGVLVIVHRYPRSFSNRKRVVGSFSEEVIGNIGWWLHTSPTKFKDGSRCMRYNSARRELWGRHMVAETPHGCCILVENP